MQCYFTSPFLLLSPRRPYLRIILPASEIGMHYEPISFKPLLFIPTTFNEDPSTGIACLDKYMGANPGMNLKSATNIRGKLLHMSTNEDCPPTVKSDIDRFNEYCEKRGPLPLDSLSRHESRAESFVGTTASVAPDNLQRQVADHNLEDEESNGEEDISDDNGCLEPQDECDGEEESGTDDTSSISSSDDGDVDAYMEYLYPDTSLHRSQIDLQPLPQVTYTSAPVYFINPFTPSETIESFKSLDPAESSSSEKRPRDDAAFESASNPRKKARTDYSYPSASTSASTSYSSSDYEEKGDDVLSEFPPGHPKSPFSKSLCKDGGFKYTCRKCPDFSTRATGDMRRHMESLAHKPKKDHVCKYPKCGGSFTRKDALKRHQMSKKHFV